MFRAHWRQVHIGPYFRGERDKRQYHRLFRPSYGESWLKMPWLFAQGYRIRSEESVASSRSSSRNIVLFDGMKGCFEPLQNKNSMIYRELSAAARHRVSAELPLLPSFHIGVHVRFGDFAIGTTTQLLGGARNTRVPQRWYAEAIAKLRELFGVAVPAIVYSDGDNNELTELLGIPGVFRIESGNSLAEMMSLSRAPAIIASGSTFSAWASFLQQAPTLYHRGQLHYPTRISGQGEVEWMPGEDVGDCFLSELRRRLSNSLR